jgi:hypothetical protein
MSADTAMRSQPERANISTRAMLREELSLRLLPELSRLGFEGPVRINGNALVHEFSRSVGGERHLLTLQLEKRGLPRFIIRVCVEPSQGFESLNIQGGRVVSGFLKPRSGGATRCWFRADPRLIERLSGRGASRHVDAVSRCLELLPEIEAWWTHRRASKHIEVYDVVYPGTSNRGNS